MVEDWAAHCFQSLLFNLRLARSSRRRSTSDFGLDPERVIEGIMRAPRPTTTRPRAAARSQTNIFRVLIKTLLNAGLITERTAASTPSMSTWTS